jgi:hypothetical protein
MDILFTPRGILIGDGSTTGIIHLHIADTSDIFNWNNGTTGILGRNPSTYTRTAIPIVPTNNSASTTPIVVKQDRVVLSVAARTGYVAVYQVNPTPFSAPYPPSPPNQCVDPFFFAETGQVANK